MTIAIFLADDHAIVRDGLRMLLNAHPNLEVIGDADNGRDAVRQISRLEPEIAIVDIAMPALNGIDAIPQIHEASPGTKVIILSMHADNNHVYQALRAGASGYLLKASAGSEVVNAIFAVHNGQRYLSPKISDVVIEDYLAHREAQQADTPLGQLSPREREILQLVVEGKSSLEIAHMLTLAPSTIDTYRSRLMQKLEINDLPSLVKFAIRHGITSVE